MMHAGETLCLLNHEGKTREAKKLIKLKMSRILEVRRKKGKGKRKGTKQRKKTEKTLAVW